MSIFDERELVLDAVDLLLVPVDRILRVGVGVALHEVGQHEGAGAVDVLPVAGAGIDHLLGHDHRVEAPGQAVVPLGVELLEAVDDGVLVLGFDLVDEVVIGADVFRARFQPVVAEHHVIRGHLAGRHDARLVGKHHALAQVEYHRRRILGFLPALGQLAALGVGWQEGVNDESVLAALPHALVEVAGDKLLIKLASVVVQLPVPVVGIPRQRRQSGEHGGDFERAAGLRLLLRPGTTRQRQPERRGDQPFGPS
jgi:hypothetical protein